MTLKEFQQRTTPEEFGSRGRNKLAPIDTILYQLERIPPPVLNLKQDVSEQTAAIISKHVNYMILLCRKIKDWQNTRGETVSDLRAARETVVKELGEQAYARLLFLTYKLNKADTALNNQKPQVKSLQPGYALERTLYVTSGKKQAPSASTISVYQKNVSETKTKSFALLTEREFLLIADKLKTAGVSLPQEVMFFKQSERMKYLILFDKKSGLFLANFDNAFDTSNGTARQFPYVIDSYGNLFSASDYDLDSLDKKVRFNHSSFAAGKDVICAGMISVIEGKLLHIDNMSGHYAPTKMNLWNALQVLNGAGVNLKDVQCQCMEVEERLDSKQMPEVGTRSRTTAQPVRPGLVAPMELDFRPKKTWQTRVTWKDASRFAEDFNAVPSQVE
jgi:hypothetical protein